MVHLLGERPMGQHGEGAGEGWTAVSVMPKGETGVGGVGVVVRGLGI